MELGTWMNEYMYRMYMFLLKYIQIYPVGTVCECALYSPFIVNHSIYGPVKKKETQQSLNFVNHLVAYD